MGSEVQDREFARHVESRGAMSDLAAALLPADTPACIHPRSAEHRRSDWRRAGGGPRVCGICHAPPTGLPTDAAS